MFRKLVSNLAFSPALVGQLGFYAKRLRKEEATRRIGLIFTALALVVQSFAVFSPPESANAASASDFVRGGVKNTSEFLTHYDQNANGIKDIFSSLGITREEIRTTKKGTINSKEVYSWGLTSRFSAAQGERQYTFTKSNGSQSTVYYRPLALWDTKPYTKQNGSTYDAVIGHSAKFGWFAIMLNCGNLITKKIPPAPPKPSSACKDLSVERISRTRYQFNGQASTKDGATIRSYTFVVKNSQGSTIKQEKITTSATSAAYIYEQDQSGKYTVELTVDTSVGKRGGANCNDTFNVSPPEMCPFNPSLKPNDPDCQPCPGDSLIWIKDKKCEAKVVQTKSATNITRGNVDATTIVANSSNRVSYTITVENTGLKETTVDLEEKLDDVLEYANLLDSGGGIYNNDTKTLRWNDVKIASGEKQSRIFVIELKQNIPSMAQGKSDRTSYDCVMTNTFGNNVEIDVNCPAPKQVEQVVDELPQTGTTENIIFAGVLLAVVTYFYARSRQMKKEVRLIRRDLHTGAI